MLLRQLLFADGKNKIWVENGSVTTSKIVCRDRLLFLFANYIPLACSLQSSAKSLIYLFSMYLKQIRWKPNLNHLSFSFLWINYPPLHPLQLLLVTTISLGYVYNSSCFCYTMTLYRSREFLIYLHFWITLAINELGTPQVYERLTRITNVNITFETSLLSIWLGFCSYVWTCLPCIH